MKIIEICPREIGFVLRGHCQNLLDDPRSVDKSHFLLFAGNATHRLTFSQIHREGQVSPSC